MTDSVFGELEFNFAWTGECKIDFCGQDYDVAIVVSGDEAEEFEAGQYDAYRAFLDKWQILQPEILDTILQYYANKRNELGYNIEQNENYPEINDTDDLLNHIKIAGIIVPYADMFDGRSMGITFDCTWDEENGVGVCLRNEKIVEVGYQDVVM